LGAVSGFRRPIRRAFRSVMERALYDMARLTSHTELSGKEVITLQIMLK
jgi:hypothetical protein